MLTRDFIKDFDYLIDRIFIEKKPTAFSRYNEWEYALISWQKFNGAWWFWHTDNEKQLLRNDLKEILKYEDDNFIFGIASRQHLRANIFYKVNIKSQQKTFATIFVNSNWSKFKQVLWNIREKVILVANNIWHDKEYPFKIKEYFWVPFDVVTYYEENKNEVLNICKQISKYNNKIVFFCAWPLSNLMIYECWKLNNTNRLIDIGSTLDEYIMWRPTRNYQKEWTKTSLQIDYL